jgi:hypothetical protein
MEGRQDAVEVVDTATGHRTRYDTFRPDAPTPYARRAPGRAPRRRHRPPTTHPDADADEERTMSAEDDAGDTVEHVLSGVSDILITGETGGKHGDAWGRYTFLGRVRPWDGLAVLLRTPVSTLYPLKHIEGIEASVCRRTRGTRIAGRGSSAGMCMGAIGLGAGGRRRARRTRSATRARSWWRGARRAGE